MPPLWPLTGPPWRTLAALLLTFLAPLQPALPWMHCSGFGLAERSSSCSSHGVLVPAHAGCRSFGINGGGLSTLSCGLGRRLRALCMLLYTPTDPNFDLPPSNRFATYARVLDSTLLVDDDGRFMGCECLAQQSSPQLTGCERPYRVRGVKGHALLRPDCDVPCGPRRRAGGHRRHAQARRGRG